jgi:RNA polymerase sigma factor (sigma-70 family)
LYSLTHQKVYFLSLNILKNKSMAEDAVQDVFIIVLDSIDKLKNPKLFLAWLNKITYNYCIRELSKSKKIGEVNSDNILPTVYDESKDNDPLQSYISKENNNELMNLINKLSQIHSTILILRYFEELKISEIAYVLNLSEGTAKSRLSNAKKNLRKLYISEKERNKKMYALFLYPLFKKASNDNTISYNSSKKILNNILSKSDKNLYGSIKLKPSPKYNIGTYMPLSVNASIVLTVSLIGICGVANYPFNQNLGDLYANKKNTLISSKNNMKELTDFKSIDIFISDMSKFTNKPVLLDVKFKNKSKLDDIYIHNKSNGKNFSGSYIDSSLYEFKIPENGDYELFVKFENSSPIVKIFKVSCIDTDGPDIIDYSFKNGDILIKLKDSVSSVNFNKISLTDSNGNNLNIKSIDKSNNSLIVNIDDEPLYLTILDYAGNKVTYSIKSF